VRVIHNWMSLLVKGFYFYEKIENFISYTTKKPMYTNKMHREHPRRWGGEVGENGEE